MEAETFTTSNVLASQQFDAWMDWFGGVVDVEPHGPPRNGFHAESQTWQIGGCAVSRLWAPAICVERTVTHVRRNPLDHWVITLSRRAMSRVSNGDTTLAVPPGTPLVLSLADQLRCDRGEDERLQLYMSRDKFADLAPALDRARGTALATPLGSLLGDFLVLLEGTLPAVGPDDLPRLSEAIGAMVAACLASGHDRTSSADRQVDLVQVERVRRAVRRYLWSPALGPHLLSRCLSMSRSKLYRLMDSEGGVARYIQHQRLNEAYALLSDPSVDRPITDLADALCFADTSAFSRAFRREFDTTPSDVRTASRTAPKLDAPPAREDNMAGANLRSLPGAL
jgi:AraC-like DNA-binding protein